MARNSKATILIHVDDIFFVGFKSYWNVFLEQISQKFSISHDQLNGPGSTIKFLRRTMTELDDGLIITPGTSVEKVVKLYEKSHGAVRSQKTPRDSSIQLPGNSAKLDKKDSTAFQSIVGLCLYVSRERPDLMFPIKELACSMASPTVTALGHLRKLVL